MAQKSIKSSAQEKSLQKKIHRTYFISGFDPRGAAHYKRMFQGDLKTHGFTLGQRITNGYITRWTITTNDRCFIDSHSEKISELCFLHWDDIARDNWPKSPMSMVLKCLEFAYWYFFRGGFNAYYKLFPGVAVCGAYPPVFLLLSICISCGFAGLIESFDFINSQILHIKLLILLLTLFSSLYVFWKIANSLGIVWLSRSIFFTHKLGLTSDKELRDRVTKFADQLSFLEDNEPSHKLKIVGHSSGSFVLAMLAAELHRRPNQINLCKRLSLITLGQNLANLGMYQRAHNFRKDLEELGHLPKIDWLDVTSREDLLCFAGVNPYTSCGLTIPFDKSYPRMDIIQLVPLNNKLSSINLLFNQFEIHFNYLRKNCHDVDFIGLLINNK